MHGNYKFSFLQSLGTVAVILNIIPATSCSTEQSFSLLRKLKTYPGSTLEEDCLSHLALLRIERAYSNRVDIEKMIDEFEKVVSSSLSNQCLFIFSFVKKVDISEFCACQSESYLAFASNKTFFVPIANCCLSALLMVFKSFFLVSPQPQYSKSDNKISVWFIYSFVSSLIFGLHIFLFGFPRH